MMKKILLFCIMTVALAMSFSACHSVDDDFQGTYVFWKPCTQWGANMNEVKAYMQSQTGWVMNLEVNNKSIIYVHKQTGMEVYYDLSDGGLDYVELSYINCEQELEHMRSDWARAYGFTWDSFGYADVPALDCYAMSSVMQLNQSVRMKLCLSHHTEK